MLKPQIIPSMTSSLQISTASGHSDVGGFTLPTQLTKKRAPQMQLTTTSVEMISKQVGSMTLKNRRPQLDSSYAGTKGSMSEVEQHQALVIKLSQRFEQRLRISESKSKTVLKDIEKRRKLVKDGDSLAALPANAGGTNTQRLVEKLRRKERDEVARVLKQTQMAQAVKKKVRIESLLPAQRRQYCQNLEQEIRQRQQNAKDNYIAKLAHEEQVRISQQIELERQKEAQRQAKILQEKLEAEARAKAEAEAAAAHKAAEEMKAIAAQQAKERAEADKLAKEEADKQTKAKVLADQQVEEEKKNEAAANADVPDLTTSLLPQASLQSRNKPYLKACPELGAQIVKQVAAWDAFETEMKALRPQDIVIDKDFYQMYPDGSKEKISKVEEAITRVGNTITRPDSNLPDEMKEQQLQRYSDEVIQRIMALNVEFSHNPNILKFGIYKLMLGFAANKFVAQAKHKLPENRKQGLEGFLVNIYDRLHFQLPQLCLKEMVLGFFGARNMLFYPKNAQLSDCQNSEAKLIEQRGFRLKGGMKESIEETIGRLQIHSVIFFSLQLSDAYIGRLFLMLSTLLSLQYTQNQAGVILHLLDVASGKLLTTYGRAFGEQLHILKKEFCPNFRNHIQNGMNNEPQNQAKYLSDGDWGQRETGLELDKLVRLVDDLLQQAAQRGF